MSLQACADLVRRGDPDRFAAAMAAPPDARAVLFPLYAFNLEVARAPHLTAEPLIAEMRLQWWRDALDEIAAGAPVRRHEVATPLAGVLDAEAAGVLDGLVAARRWDIEGERFADAEALSAHLDATAGHLMWTAARLLGAAPEAERPVRDCAHAQGLAAWLRAVPDYRARNRAPLPDDRPGAVQVLAREGLRRLGRGRAARHAIAPRARPALYPAWLAGAVLRRAAARPERVGEGGLAPSPFRARAGLVVLALAGRW